jgi:polyferredoxin
MKKYIFLLLQVILITTIAAEARFPKPEFTSGYKIPEPLAPSPYITLLVNVFFAFVILILVIVMMLGIRYLYRKRSRAGIIVLALFSLLFFGFFRGGCLCPIGAIQNIAVAIFEPVFSLGWFGILIFFLPILFALFAGRVFCGVACPLGAIQDIINFYPLRLPKWLDRTLRLLPIFYLGFAVYFAVLGIGFIICKYDPFVVFFRFSGDLFIMLAGSLLLLLGVFVCRPYCRFFCPYGVILGWAALLSARRIKITPDECIKCRLCENACPVDAIVIPQNHTANEPLRFSISRGLRLITILPVVIVISAVIGWCTGPILAQQHSAVKLYQQVTFEINNGIRPQNDATLAFRSSDATLADLQHKNSQIIYSSKIGGLFLGIFLSLMVMLRLFKFSKINYHADYQTDSEYCICCGRCYRYCPRGRLDTGKDNGSNT